MYQAPRHRLREPCDLEQVCGRVLHSSSAGVEFLDLYIPMQHSWVSSPHLRSWTSRSTQSERQSANECVVRACRGFVPGRDVWIDHGERLLHQDDRRDQSSEARRSAHSRLRMGNSQQVAANLSRVPHVHVSQFPDTRSAAQALGSLVSGSTGFAGLEGRPGLI